MIVVEGPDGAGKSTLVDQLVEKLHLPIAPKLVNSDMSTNADKKTWCEHNVAQGFQPVIFDRHCLISEPIYNSSTRKAFEAGFDDVAWVNAMLTMFYRHCRPFIIYCLPDYETVRKNVHHGVVGQPSAVQHAIRKIYAQYVAKAAADTVLAGAMVYNFKLSNVDTVVKTIDQAIERMGHEHTARPLWS